MSNKYITNGITGIWNSYGCSPSPGAGVSISLEHTPGIDTNLTGSLIDLYGFQSSTIDIGVLSDYQKIMELVVMLPMVELQPQSSDSYGTFFPEEQPPPEEIDPCACTDDPCGHKTYKESRNSKPNSRSDQDLYYSKVENAYLFKIKENIINKILDVSDYKLLNIFAIKEKLYARLPFLNGSNNIVKLMIRMVSFNFPPHLNWLLYNNIPPIALYTFEYSVDLDRDDLSDIWQGNMPQPAKYPQPEPDIQEIEHYLSDEEIFGGYDLNKFDDIKLKIFKCKYRSEGDYDSLIKGKTSNRTNWYGYNWPYDYCSIVEYLQIQAGEVRDYVSDVSVEQGVIKEEMTKSTTRDGITVTGRYDPTYNETFDITKDY